MPIGLSLRGQLLTNGGEALEFPSLQSALDWANTNTPGWVAELVVTMLDETPVLLKTPVNPNA